MIISPSFLAFHPLIHRSPLPLALLFLEQMEFWISVLLTILGYLPGVLYAAYVILSVDPDRVRRRGHDDDDDYIYVA